jgi:hypothetical protein
VIKSNIVPACGIVRVVSSPLERPPVSRDTMVVDRRMTVGFLGLR